MSFFAVAGLRVALKEYESDKVRERTSGAERLREIFGNKENLWLFHESGGQQGGAGWVALFQSLFAGVSVEKRGMKRGNASTMTEKRLAESISLVRWMAERTVHLIARRPLIALVTHMTALLVHQNGIFEPAVRDYAKALRQLLVYPPHLESLDEALWKRLMSIIWAGALGDRISQDDQWQDSGHDQLEGDDGNGEGDEDGDEDMERDDKAAVERYVAGRAKGVTHIQSELLLLLPILLASPSAPTLPAFPDKDSPTQPPTSVGYLIILKIVRFLEAHPAETSAHLSVFKGLNLILAEMELNSRNELVDAGTRLLPLLQGLWLARSKPLREQVVIALRTLHPFVSHFSVAASTKEVVLEQYGRIVEGLGREVSLRWGIGPLDMGTLLLEKSAGEAGGRSDIFTVCGIRPGFDFMHEHAFSWAILETYASCYLHLITASPASHSANGKADNGERKAKRARTENHLANLLRSTTSGPNLSRSLAVQTLIFILHQSSASIADDAKIEITAKVFELLDADDETVQSWAYLLAAVAIPAGAVDRASAERIWGSCMRKMAMAGICRPAAHCALGILASKLVSTDMTTSGIGDFLRQIDLQGPSFPFDSVASLVASSLGIARSDVRLYSSHLEDKALTWLARYNLMEGTRGKSRMEAHTVHELAALIAATSDLSAPPERQPSVLDWLPDCAIVEHVVQERKTAGIRQFILDGIVPSSPTTTSPSRGSNTGTADSIMQPTLSPLTTAFPSTAAHNSTDESAIPNPLQNRVSAWLRLQLKQEIVAFDEEKTASGSRPAERVRKALDLALLGVYYLGMLRKANIRSDSGLADMVRGMLEGIRPELNASMRSPTGQYQIWSGLSPLLPSYRRREEDWPVLLRHGESSGTRPDLLPVYKDEDEAKGEAEITWLGELWTLSELSETLKSFILSARDSGNPAPFSADPTQAPLSTQAPTTMEEDDEFGEIRNAEADAMPLAKEGGEGQRKGQALLRLQVQVRLFGAGMQSGRGAVKDTALLNTMLGLEGPRYLQMAEIVSEAVSEGHLRLTPTAIEHILDQLSSTVCSYVHSRDQRMFLICLSFLRCTASIWLTDGADIAIQQKAMDMAFWLVRKQSTVPSWQVHLAILLFIDEYLDYEPESVLWREYMLRTQESATDEHGNDAMSILSVVARALVHRDIRVRIRGATSTAGLWYLPSMDAAQHQEFYLQVMSQQPRMPTYWNAFLTDMLWKLNCLVASASARSAVLFHLLEIPPTTSTFDLHLTRGLASVASRLGLPSHAALFDTYALPVVNYLLSSQQSPLDLPPSVCGYLEGKSRAESILTNLTASVLEHERFAFLQQLCEETGHVQSAYTLAYAFPLAARLLCKVAADSSMNSDGKIIAHLANALDAMPFAGKITAKTFVKDHATQIAVEILRLAACHHTAPSLAQAMSTFEGSSADIFLSLIDHALLPEAAHPDLINATWSELALFKALSLVISVIREIPTTSRKTRDDDKLQRQLLDAITFNALLQLFADLNQSVLLSERARLTTCIAIAIACFPLALNDPRVTQVIMQEAMSIVELDDTASFALRLLDLVLGNLNSCASAVPRLEECFIRLGRCYPRLASPLQDQFIDMLSRVSAIWRSYRQTDGGQVWDTAKACSTLWPSDMRQVLGDQYEVPFDSVAQLAILAQSGDTMILCDKLAQALQACAEKDVIAGKQSFSQDLFWHIKRSFDAPQWTIHGARAFIELLASVEGHVQTVCVSPNQQGNDDRLWDKVLASRVKNDANLLVQVLVIRHLAKLSCSDDQSVRYPAYWVLRQLQGYVNPVIDGGLMPKSARAELPLLLSPYPSGIERSPVVSMSDLQRDNFAQYAAEPEVWLRKTAFALSCIAIDCSAQLAPFYGALSPALYGQAESIAPFIPILTQAILAGSQDAKILDTRRKALRHLYEKSLRHPGAHPIVVESILAVMLRLRNFAPPFNPKDALGSLSWLDWDYLLLAESASKAGAYATALLCLEIAVADIRTNGADLHSNRVQEILLQIYSNVDDPDGFYGIKTNNVRQNLQRRLDHEGQHMRAFGLHGAELELHRSQKAQRSDLLASARHLHSFGLNRTAQTIARAVQNGTGDATDRTEDLFYDIAWRTGEWDLPVSDAVHLTSSGSFYSALRAVHRERDSETAKSRIEEAIKVEMIRLKDLGTERMSEMNRSIDHLICLGDAHRWYESDIQQSLLTGEAPAAASHSFVHIPVDMRYSLADCQHATRVSILSAAQAREKQNFLGDLSSPLGDGLAALEVNSRLRFCQFARQEGNSQAAINAITAVQNIEDANPSAKATDEFGAVLWMQGEHALALQQVNEMLEGLESMSGGLSQDQSRRLGVLLGRQAHWSHLSRQLTSHTVVDKYSKAVSLLNKHKASDDEVAQLSFDFACFAADEQHHLRNNGELDALREFRSRKQIALDKHAAATKDARRVSRSLEDSRDERERSLERENDKVREHEKAIDNLTVHALRSFAQAFTKSDKFDDSITRMCSIWLAHADSKNASDDNEKRRADGIAQAFASFISSVPSYKFIFLGPQLAARLHLSSQKRPFDHQLNGVMLRLAQDHPFHILYQVVPLASSAPAAAKGRKSMPAADAAEGRGPAANWLLQQLEADQVHTTARQASRHMRAFADIVTAYCWVKPPSRDESNGRGVKVGNAAISRLPSDMDIPVATVIPTVRPDRNYSDVPRLTRYSSTYDILGGVHRPRKMKCYDSASNTHFQIFKGDDEIRQDAIMEQVFGMTNNILKRDRQTKARRLNFRTYVVIPLANKTGIIEFCAEGIALGDWLKPAHDRYRKPEDLKASAIREIMFSLQGKVPDVELIQRWKAETPRFPPVMRHFFREKQPEPMAWFTMRLNYARSVAVTSMVGHMLGIGDRHLSNVMIDQVNGELIHIDFGIVFEEGLNLRIPERVPFRLTRDMIDGLGVMGVDGTFRRCSEQTLRVLRSSSPLIMTVLEVFKHDPLFAWMGDPDKLNRAQGGNKATSDISQAMAQDKADRILSKIRGKLKDELGVEYTVNQLVLEATDPANLGTIYTGWHSWF